MPGPWSPFERLTIVDPQLPPLTERSPMNLYATHAAGNNKGIALVDIDASGSVTASSPASRYGDKELRTARPHDHELSVRVRFFQSSPRLWHIFTTLLSSCWQRVSLVLFYLAVA